MKIQFGLVAMAVIGGCKSIEDVNSNFSEQWSGVNDLHVGPGPVEMAKCVAGEAHLVAKKGPINDLGTIARVMGKDGGALVIDTIESGLQWWEPGMEGPTQQWNEPAPYQAIVGLNRQGQGVIEYGTRFEEGITELDSETFEVVRQVEMPEAVWGIEHLAVSPNGRWAIPGQFFVYYDAFHLLDLKSGTALSSMAHTDGVNKALFFDDERFLLAGSVNLAGIELQIRDVNQPEKVLAAWSLEERRCGSMANVYDILLDETGRSVLVVGDIYGSLFMAVLDATTLEERAIMFDIGWQNTAPTFVDANTIVTGGDKIRFWDANTLEVTQELDVGAPIRHVVYWDDTLVTTRNDGSIQQLQCHTGH